MSLFDIDSIIYRFLLHEGQEQTPDASSYIQVVTEILSKLRPNSLKEKRYISIAMQHLKEINKHVRKMNEKLSILEEQLRLLEEEKTKKSKKA